MLRIEFDEVDHLLTMRVQDRFVDRFAEEARTRVSRRKIPATFIVDLFQVSFIDTTGEEVLSWLGSRFGATFLAESAHASDVCKRPHL